MSGVFIIFIQSALIDDIPDTFCILCCALDVWLCMYTEDLLCGRCQGVRLAARDIADKSLREISIIKHGWEQGQFIGMKDHILRFTTLAQGYIQFFKWAIWKIMIRDMFINPQNKGYSQQCRQRISGNLWKIGFGQYPGNPDAKNRP